MRMEAGDGGRLVAKGCSWYCKDMDFAEIRDDEEDGVLAERPGCLRGLFRLLLFLLVTLFAVVALIPTLLSSDGGRKWALTKVNAAVAPAQVTCGKWSLGWFRSPVLEKVGYVDAESGADIKVEQVVFDRGLLRLLPVGVMNLGEVTLKRPDIAVSLVPQTKVVSTKGAAKETKKGFFFLPVVDVAAVLNAEDGRVTVTGPAPVPFVAEQVAGSVTLTSYKRPIAMQTRMRIGGGTLALEGHVQSLKDFYKGTVLEQPERLTLKLLGVDLTAFRPLLQYATGEPWVCSGVAEGVLTAAIKGKSRGGLEGGLMVTGLSVAGAGQPRSPKGDVALMVDLGYDKKVVQVAKFEFSSPWVRADAKGTLQAGSKAGVMTGSIQAKATVHLADVARDFAPVLGLSKGFKIQKGELRATFVLEGSEEAMRVDASAMTADLAMTIDGEPLVLKPEPSLVFKAKFPYGAWPEVETFRFKAPFADVYGSGRFDAAVVKGKLDLTRFSRDFKRMLKESPPMVGSAYLDVTSKREKDGVAVTSFLKLSDVAAELRPGQRTVVSQGTLKFEGRVPLKQGKPVGEVLDAAFELTLENGKVAGGWKRLVPAGTSRPLQVRGFALTSDMDVGSVRRLLGGFIPAPVQRRMTAWQGRMIANATAEAAGGVMKARLNAAGQQLVAGVDDGVWRVPDIRLEGVVTQGGPTEGVRVELTATGGGSLERDGETVFAERSARVVADATVAADGNRVQVSKLAVSSGLFELETQGEVTELSTRCLVTAKGNAALDFGAVTQWLEVKGFDEFAMTGRTLREFRFASPVAGGLATVLAEGELSGAASVGSFKGLGLTAGPADASFLLSKGLLKVAYEPALNGGKLRLVPEVEVGGRGGAFGFPAKTRLLENVTLTQKMMDTLLVNMNPLLQGSTVLGGTVTLDLRSCHVVPGLTVDKGVAVDMDVLLKQLKLEMGPSLRELLSMIKVKERVYEVDQLPVHVVIKEGRIHMDPVKMVIDKQPVVCSGWVAFDGTIKYLIEVPVTERLAGGMAGKMLKGAVIKIPVAGTVMEPRLDTSAVQDTLGSLLKSAVGEQAVEKVGSFLEKLQRELNK